MSMAPTLNGRNRQGRFVVGNPGGNGNPHIGAIERFRSALYRAVTPEDFEALAKKLVSMGKKGNVHAITELFNRMLGKPIAQVDVNVEQKPQLSALEQRARMVQMLRDPHTRELLRGALEEAERPDSVEVTATVVESGDDSG